MNYGKTSLAPQSKNLDFGRSIMTTGQGIQTLPAERQPPLVKNKKRTLSPKSIPQTDFNQNGPKGWARPDLFSLKNLETLTAPQTTPFPLGLDPEIEATGTIIPSVIMKTDFKPIDLPPMASVIGRTTNIDSETVIPNAQTQAQPKLTLPKLELSIMEVQKSDPGAKRPEPPRMQQLKPESTPKNSIKSSSPQQNDLPAYNVSRPAIRNSIPSKTEDSNYSGQKTKEST